MAEKPIVIGLTGGIGMGKSTVASQFAAFGARVCNADTLVHQLLGPGGKAEADVKKAFPEASTATGIDRGILGKIVFTDSAKRKALEAILHPMVIAQENEFIARQQEVGTKMVVLDIPLLFETGGEARCNFTVLATAPAFIQKRRVMKRPGMTEEKFRAIVAAQMPDGEKRQRADFIVQTGFGKIYSRLQVARIVRKLNEA
jgi:dephospho-CoA kinase